jgi:hypothetical protein
MRKITARELSKILKKHKRWYNTDEDEGEKANLSGADLSDANLSGADLSDANLSKANLSGADLRFADLSRTYLSVAELTCAKLRFADLSDADLSDANLNGANLNGANLSDANMSRANLSRANLSRANLSRANLSRANLSGANLIRVRGLTLEQLSSVATLYDAGLSSERIKQVRKKYPHLLGEIEPDEEKLSKRRIITLRSSYKKLSVSEAHSMPNVSIREKDDWGFEGLSTIKHDYSLKAVSGDVVVVDNATGLMWHQGGSDDSMEWDEAKEWVEDLNSEEGYAGYQDWRLPTVDEAVSLLELSKTNGDLYIDPVFIKKQSWIWTGDKFGSEAAWGVHFYDGDVCWPQIQRHHHHIRYVRPVRSVK